MILTALVLFLARFSLSSAEACADVNLDTLAMFSSKTAYEFVHGENVSPQQTVSGCEAVQFWHLNRHGTRYPVEKEVVKMASRLPGIRKRIEENYKAKRVQLCNADVEKILQWKMSAEADMLTSQGQADLFGIGKRFRERFPVLLRANETSLDNYVFRHTVKERTKQSALWYIKGMFGDVKVDLPKPSENDPLMRFYDLCPKYTAAVNKNATARQPIVEFQTGDAMSEALSRVSRRLGFNETLSYDDVDLLWEACRYDRAWRPSPSVPAPWCASFHKDDLQVFEYRADIKYYYMNAYGNELNLRVGCPLVKDLVERFSLFVKLGSGPRGIMYFAHSTALQMTLARLGVGRDPEPLTAANFERMKNGRRWNISKLGPFASNIAAVLYKCDARGGGGRFKVRLYVNEKPLRLKGCPDNTDLCPWEDFMANFADVASTCSLDFCKI